MAKISTMQFRQPGDDQAMYVLAVADELAVYTLTIGYLPAVREAVAVLATLAETGQADEIVSHLDERLGYRWLSVSEAAREFGVPHSTIRRAAADGLIRGAKKYGRDHRFPQPTFLDWFSNVYRPRRQAMEYADQLTNYGQNDPAEAD